MKHQEFRINKETGEIIGVYEVTDVTPMTQKEKNFYKYSSISPVSARNKEQLEDYISVCMDKRKFVTFNNTNELHNMSCGISVRNKTKNVFTLPQYKTMNKLIKNLTLANIVIGTKREIADILGCKTSDIKRTLKPVSHLVRVLEESVDKGVIKILVHPAYGFKYESDLIDKVRIAALKDWVKVQDWEEQQEILSVSQERMIKEIEWSKGMEKFLNDLNKQAANRAKESYKMKELGIEQPTLGIEEQKFIQDYYNGTKESLYSR